LTSFAQQETFRAFICIEALHLVTVSLDPSLTNMQREPTDFQRENRNNIYSKDTIDLAVALVCSLSLVFLPTFPARHS
jgi:hypothetical protein